MHACLLKNLYALLTEICDEIFEFN
jgi:hypothetical protein